VLLEEASTPDQQQAAAGKSLTRKIREARYALALEQRWPKTKILEGYLNIAFFGNNAYGIGAAAQRYFGASVGQLSLEQSALLAGLVQGPSTYDPLRHPQAATARRNEVLARMRQLGHITAGQETVTRSQPLGLRPVLPPAAADPCLSSPAPFFCDYVRQILLADKALGATRAERDHLLLEGGLTVKTSFDPAVQRAAQQAVDSTVEKTNRAAATEAIVKPGTGQALAMAVSRDYGTAPGQTTVALPTQPAFGPGSTFKVFTLAAAVAQGLPLSTSYFAPACTSPPPSLLAATAEAARPMRDLDHHADRDARRLRRARTVPPGARPCRGRHRHQRPGRRADQRHRLPQRGHHRAGPPPARPAPTKRSPAPGSSATPPSSPPPSNSATPAAAPPTP